MPFSHHFALLIKKLPVFIIGYLVGILSYPFFLPEGNKKPPTTEHYSASNETLSLVSTNLPTAEEKPYTQLNQTDTSYASLLTALFSQQESLTKQAKIQLLVTQWANQAPFDTLTFLTRHKQSGHVWLVMEIAGSQQNNQVFDWLKQHEHHSQFNYWAQPYFKGSAQKDNAVALQQVAQLAQQKHRENLTFTIIEQWLKEAPEATFDWIAEQPPSAHRQALNYSALNQFILQSPWQAAEKIVLLPPSAQQEQLLMALLDTLAQQDIAESLDFIARLPKTQEQQLLGVVLSHWVNQGNSEEALNYLLNRQEIHLTTDAFNAVMINIANQQPDFLLQRLHEFPPQEKRNVIEAIVTSKLNQAQTPDYTWIEEITDETLYQHAKISLIQGIYHGKPLVAFNLAESIYLTADKMTQLEIIVASWSKYDNDAAINAVLNSASLNQQQKDKLVNLSLNSKRY